MIILGDISGIQTYLFDVADAGGGQALRQRACLFYIQLIAEVAALRVLQSRAGLVTMCIAAVIQLMPSERRLETNTYESKILRSQVGVSSIWAGNEATDANRCSWITTYRL